MESMSESEMVSPASSRTWEGTSDREDDMVNVSMKEEKNERGL